MNFKCEKCGTTAEVKINDYCPKCGSEKFKEVNSAKRLYLKSMKCANNLLFI